MCTSNHLSGFFFVYFEDDRDAEDAIHGLDNRPFGYDMCKLFVEWARGERGRHCDGTRSTNQRLTKTLFVIKFDLLRTQVRDIERHFEPYGKVLHDDDERGDCSYDSPRRGGYVHCGDSPYGRSPSPMYRRRPSPHYGRPCSPTYDRYNGLAYDKRMSPDYGRNISPEYGSYPYFACDSCRLIPINLCTCRRFPIRRSQT
ncbi:hypothetical protein UlMin_046089 [Ulmus minor]